MFIECEYFTTRLDDIKIYHKITIPAKKEIQQLKNDHAELFI